MPITINASASGSPLPPLATFPVTVTNGDFLIEGNSAATLVGDGINDWVRWTFDFNSDPALPCFDRSRGLTSAFLTLILTPMHSEVDGDAVKIDHSDFDWVRDPKIHGLRFSQDKPETQSVGIELLHSYAAVKILEVFAPSNTIPMWYSDDAIVSGAKLQLVQNDPARLYSVKVVCGDSDGEIVSPGRYFTAINVHNPSCTSVRFRYKVALACPGEPGEVSPFKEVSLGPDQAFEIDCAQVRELVESDQRFLKGFVVIESEYELDVVAVYTAGAPEVRTFHTERVAPRIGKSAGEPQPPDDRLPD